MTWQYGGRFLGFCPGVWRGAAPGCSHNCGTAWGWKCDCKDEDGEDEQAWKASAEGPERAVAGGERRDRVEARLGIDGEDPALEPEDVDTSGEQAPQGRGQEGG